MISYGKKAYKPYNTKQRNGLLLYRTEGYTLTVYILKSYSKSSPRLS